MLPVLGTDGNKIGRKAAITPALQPGRRYTIVVKIFLH